MGPVLRSTFPFPFPSFPFPSLFPISFAPSQFPMSRFQLQKPPYLIYSKTLPTPAQLAHGTRSSIKKLTVPFPSQRQQSRPPMRGSPAV
ncbi:hypothetical protein GALMADRAFT_237650 [Galerina marginata CBS 339.88]|uniref:Uncharacterized protein n=1 Tax=Galerina marginata (strain CBS 339.88) TaxID=685588 RepID=A0A067TGN1_GALM3|nr:hypothetical protein GALMADRAFT_237650 [Galerina marginata CBS 339.88]